MKVLLVGQGGREHALAWKLAQSPSVERVIAAPGNPGLAGMAVCEPVDASDVAGLVALAERESVDLTVVGPEAPLVAGLADQLEARGLRVFGPTKAAARIEGSKSWAKELCERYGIPASGSRSFTSYSDAVSYLEGAEPPHVIKADGLASGKGVTVTDERDEAVEAVRAALSGPDRRVVVEEFLKGREVSALALTDGQTVLPLALAQDYKRIGDGDSGPNTGGMGAYSPVFNLADETLARILGQILEPTVKALRSEGIAYRGVLYAGLMITDDGPRVLEFNCRFGDPETQAIVPRMVFDLADSLLACSEGDLAGRHLSWADQACVTVVLASEGYPGDPRTGLEVEGLDQAGSLQDVFLFHGGTALQDGRVLTSGGRVLAVSALGPSVDAARERAYEACSMIRFDGMQYRTDIARGVSGATVG